MNLKIENSENIRTKSIQIGNWKRENEESEGRSRVNENQIGTNREESEGHDNGD